MNFITEVLHEAAKRRGMPYEGLLSYIRRERKKGNTSVGLGEDFNKKEAEMEMFAEGESLMNTEITEKVDGINPETTEGLGEQTEPATKQLLETDILTVLPVKTTGSSGNFGRQTENKQEAGSVGERLGRMASTECSHHYFK